MEIKPGDKIMTFAVSDPIQKRGQGSGMTFGTVFDEMCEMCNDSEVLEPESFVVPMVGNIQAPPCLGPLPTAGTFIVNQTEKLLDLLDTYQEKLASPEFSLRDIGPLVRKMDVANKLLASEAEALSQGDELKTILNQLVIVSSVEVVKFDRGDYIQP